MLERPVASGWRLWVGSAFGAILALTAIDRLNYLGVALPTYAAGLGVLLLLLALALAGSKQTFARRLRQ